MRITLEELAETKAVFLKKGFIDKHWNVLKWDKRQVCVSPSVSPAALRMRAMRERERNELRNSDVTNNARVAQPRVRAELEEEENREEERRIPPYGPPSGGMPTDVGQSLSAPHPKKTGKRKPEPLPDLPDWTPLEDWSEWLTVRIKKRAPNTGYALRLAIKKLTELRDEGHDPVKVLQKAIVAGNTSLWPPGSIFSNGKNGSVAPKHNPTAAEYEAKLRRMEAAKAHTERMNELTREARSGGIVRK